MRRTKTPRPLDPQFLLRQHRIATAFQHGPVVEGRQFFGVAKLYSGETLIADRIVTIPWPYTPQMCAFAGKEAVERLCRLWLEAHMAGPVPA